MPRHSTLLTSTAVLFFACGSPSESGTEVGGSSDNGATPPANDATGGVTNEPEPGNTAGAGGAPTSGGVGADTGGSSSGGSEPMGPVADLFEHCDYEGWGVSLAVGEYTTADLVALGAFDDDASSIRVSPGFEVVLFDGDNFTGDSITITADMACVVTSNFNDLTSSVRVQVSQGGSGGTDGSGGDGSGGATGTGGADGGGGTGPTTCGAAFETACKPSINFDNQHSDGGGALFDELFPNIEEDMKDIACTVCSILYRDPNEIPEHRRHSTINLTIDAHDGVAYASGNSITMSVNHLQNYTNPDSAYVEYRGVLVHETVHLYQHYGNGGTGEGMADAVRIRVGLYSPGRCRTGGSWRDAYTTSGCFYSWLTGSSSYHDNAHPNADADLPYKINAALAGTNGEASYSAVSTLLSDTFAQDVDTLWDLYQADL